MTMLDDKAAAKQLGDIPERTLAQWRWKGYGPRFVKVGKHVRYRLEDIEAWIEAQSVDPAHRSRESLGSVRAGDAR